MTVWEHLVANSTLAEGDGDAWDHLTNPSGTGGAGDVIINSELIMVVEDDVIIITEYSDKLVIIEDELITLVEIEDVIKINEEEEDILDVIC